MSTISKTTQVIAGARNVSCDLNGETAILNLDSGKYYGLNEVGSFIWGRIQQRKVSVVEVLESVQKHFEVDPQRAESDLMHLLDRLAAEGLIHCE